MFYGERSLRGALDSFYFLYVCVHVMMSVLGSTEGEKGPSKSHLRA